jgi:O-6-methylguanine DNA methyltransferase
VTWRLSIATDDGEFIAGLSKRGLVRLEFPNDSNRRPPAEAGDHPVSIEQRTWAAMTADALHLALAGRNPVTLPPFDWTGHTPFRQQVWRAMLRIAPGQTRTYAQIAVEVGSPDATRATGTACGANPIPVLVPCHRVVAANGKLGGFSGGLDWKRRLLGREGVRLELAPQNGGQ